MKKRIISLFICALLLTSVLPFSASAQSGLLGTPTAPQNVSAYFYSWDNETGNVLESIMLGFTVGDYLKNLNTTWDNAFQEANNVGSTLVRLQVDYKLNAGGSWQYGSSWDADPDNAPLNYHVVDFELTTGDYLFSTEELTAIPDASSVSFMQQNTIYFRARYFVYYFDNASGQDVAAISAWSSTACVGKDAQSVTTKPEAPVLNSAELLKDEDGVPFFRVGITVTDNIKALDTTGGTTLVELSYRIDGGAWDTTAGDWLIEKTMDIKPENVGNGDEIKINAGTYDIRLRYGYVKQGDDMDEAHTSWSDYSNIVTIATGAYYSNASSWATTELKKAGDLGLIPDCLKGTDMTKAINRAEFAAVCVKVYENLSGLTAQPISANPFTDCTDSEVLKAYNVGITNGVTATTFSPKETMNREQAATMLTRVYKCVTMKGWTLNTDSQFTLKYDMPAVFSDDAQISAWAKDSVYFMNANGVINGVGDNKFAPKNTTSAQEAAGYASATREQALIIAIRMVENLK
jgi:hypothetical protein